MTWRKLDPASLRPRRRAGPSIPPDPPTAAVKKRWDHEQIRRARKIPLAPLLRQRGYPLRQRPGDNFLVQDHQDLVVKDSYWVWPSRRLQGNAIDFLMLVECRSFHEAMEILAPSDPEAED